MAHSLAKGLLIHLQKIARGAAPSSQVPPLSAFTMSQIYATLSLDNSDDVYVDIALTEEHSGVYEVYINVSYNPELDKDGEVFHQVGCLENEAISYIRRGVKRLPRPAPAGPSDVVLLINGKKIVLKPSTLLSREIFDILDERIGGPDAEDSEEEEDEEEEDEQEEEEDDCDSLCSCCHEKEMPLKW